MSNSDGYVRVGRLTFKARMFGSAFSNTRHLSKLWELTPYIGCYQGNLK